jgi:beta-glucosidase
MTLTMMIRSIVSILVAGLLVSEASAQLASDRVERLLEAMTLEEKVGQMTQLTLEVVADEGPPGRADLDAERMREALLERHVGSIINVVGRALSLDGWHALIGELQDVAMGETRLGIPLLYGIDAVHGQNYTRGGTVFPHNIGMAATFDRELVRESARITAAEVAASSQSWNFAPVMDVGRVPLWPRYYETFGEDPYVASELGAAAVTGMQASGKVAATPKHYLGYSGSDVGRDRTPANLTERVVREYYLPPFRAAIEAGAKTIMINSGEIDGEPVHASRFWLTDVLRGELGFRGVAVTDWLDVAFLHTRHRVAPTMRDAVRIAVDAGIDMSMTPYDYEFADHLIDLVRSGEISEDRVDTSVRRILTLKENLGLFETPGAGPERSAEFGRSQSVERARLAARATMTLLSNDGTLPLSPEARIVVTGPAATSLTALNGGWTYTWQGTDPSDFPANTPSILDAIRARAPSVEFIEGAGFDVDGDVDAARAAAERADVVVLAIGEDAYAEWVGDIDDLSLSPSQQRLAAAVIESGTPVVMVLVEGRPRIVHPYADQAAAVLMAYTPGMQGAEAIADVLFGDHNPSGRLPLTYPRHPNALDTYDHRYTQRLGRGFDRADEAFDPQFEFGTGLSYTTFDYTDLELSSGEITPDGSIRVSVTVTNSGDRSGRHAVLLFVRQHYASLTPAVRRLRNFKTIDLAPGESASVTFDLDHRDLRYVLRDGSWQLEPGAFDVMVGDLTATFQLQPQ